MAYQIAKIQDKIPIQNAFINKDALQMCLDISIFLKMISARILAMFFIFYCEICSPIHTTEQQQFCASQYGKLSFNLFFFTVLLSCVNFNYSL